MHIVTILASPHADGNTATVLGWVEESLHKHKHQTTRILLSEKTIAACRGCYACAESPDEPGCVIDDDATGVFEQMIAADALLFATPLYMWSYPGSLKTLVDRCLCLAKGYASPDHRSFVEGKPGALLVTCASGIENNADAIQLSFPRFADYLKLVNKGVFVFPHCTTPDKLPNTHGSKAHDISFCLAKC